MMGSNTKTIKLFWILQISQISFLLLFFLLTALTMLITIRQETLRQIGKEMEKRNIILQLTLMEAFDRKEPSPDFPLPHPTQPDSEDFPNSSEPYDRFFLYDYQAPSYYGRFDVLKIMEERIRVACDLTNTRFTVFSPLAHINFDSDLSFSQMDKERHVTPEFIEAVQEGSGLSVRKDEKTGEKMIYQALPLYVRDELIGVTRVSQAYELTKDFRAGITSRAALYIILALLLLFFISFLFIRNVTATFRKMESALSNISNGDYDFRLPPYKIKELNSLAITINDMSGKLKMQNSELEALTMIDELTGLGNRRMFNQKLDFSWWMCIRERKPISFLMLDIDKFKQFNDTLGHPEGDCCLRKVSQLLQSSINRHTDILTRMGGEEFGVLLPGSDENQARAVGEIILDLMNETRLPHPSSPVAPYVTLSIGQATLYPNASDCMESLLDLADKALYKAKEEGRNCLRKL